MSELVASDRGPGLLLGPGVELPDDVLLGGHVVIYGGTLIEPGCRIQDGAVIGKRQLVSPTARSAAGAAESPTVLERGAAAGCKAVIVAGAGDHTLIRERVVLEAGAVVGSGSGIGPGCRIGAGSRLMPGALLALDTVVEEGVFCGPRLVVTPLHELIGAARQLLAARGERQAGVAFGAER